jgi:predicted RNA-binding protein with PIN domain
VASTPATWIIDGNNLIHRDPRLRAILEQSGFEPARRFLEAELGRRRGGGHRFHVVYDGGRVGRTRGVSVAVARAGKTADEEILRLAREHPGGGTVRIVTSDRADIGRRLAGLSVEWVSVEEFRRVLWAPTGPGAPAAGEAAGEKPGPPRGREVDRWLEAFGEGGADGDR